MVSSVEIIQTIRDCLLRFKAKNIVIDPVMIAKSGDPLLRPEAEQAVRDFAGIADILTPNIPEAEIISGMKIQTKDDMLLAAEKIAALGLAQERALGQVPGRELEQVPGGASPGPRYVLIKGGHRLGTDAEDLFYSAGTAESPASAIWLPEKRTPTKHTHGTGCTLSSAIACRLALGDSPEEAVREAKTYITQAIKDFYALGKGNGPVGHLRDLYRRAGLEIGE
jgi:hydroxymethylpyrimidine/phosphomethylpyrimidine kinase